MRRIIGTAFAVLSLSFIMGACSSDSSQVADLVKKQAETETGLKDLKANCPKDLEAKKGNKGSCTVTGDFSTWLKGLGCDVGDKKITEVKYDVEFPEDRKVLMTPDTADFQAKVGTSCAAATGGGAGTGSSTASTSSESSTSADSTSSASTSADSTADVPTVST